MIDASLPMIRNELGDIRIQAKGFDDVAGALVCELM